jgi:hypothetical protein
MDPGTPAEDPSHDPALPPRGAPGSGPGRGLGPRPQVDRRPRGEPVQAPPVLNPAPAQPRPGSTPPRLSPAPPQLHRTLARPALRHAHSGRAPRTGFPRVSGPHRPSIPRPAGRPARPVEASGIGGSSSLRAPRTTPRPARSRSCGSARARGAAVAAQRFRELSARRGHTGPGAGPWADGGGNPGLRRTGLARLSQPEADAPAVSARSARAGPAPPAGPARTPPAGRCAPPGPGSGTAGRC